MIRDSFESINDFDVDKLSVDTRIVINNTVDGPLTQRDPGFVDLLFQVERHFYVNRSDFRIQAIEVEINEPLYAFPKFQNIVLDILGDKLVFVLTFGRPVGKPITTVANRLLFRHDSEVLSDFPASFLAELIRGTVSHKFEKLLSYGVAFRFHGPQLFYFYG